MNNPKISVITVCFNAVDTIENTILSVINQTYNNIEYIIIDGASTDGTTDIIRKYEDKIAYWISEPDKGIYDAMNKATKVATGDYIFFLNSGDVFYSKDTLSMISSYMSNNRTVYYGNVIKVPQNIRSGRKFGKWHITGKNICHQSIFYPYIVFVKYEFDIKYCLYADWVLNMACMGDRTLKFEYLDQIVSLYNTQGVSYTGKDDLFYMNRLHIIKDHLGIIYYLFARFLRDVRVTLAFFRRG